MLDKKQRGMVMKLFGGGMGVSEIARKVGISRQSVYRVIQSDFDEDPNIHALQKRLKEAELREKIRKVREPSRTENELADMKNVIAEMKAVINKLISRVLSLWYHVPEVGESAGWNPPKCAYCGGELKYVEEEEEEVQEYRCNSCGKVFPFP